MSTTCLIYLFLQTSKMRSYFSFAMASQTTTEGVLIMGALSQSATALADEAFTAEVKVSVAVCNPSLIFD